MAEKEKRKDAPWRPFSEMARWEQLMGRRLDDFLEQTMLRRWPHGLNREPPIEVFEEPDELVVRVELPGVDKNDVDLAVKDRSLTIRGERKQSRERSENYYHSEIVYGVFSRVIHLPCEVQTATARAYFDKGILEVWLPKSESAKETGTKINVT
jgi:HSP20 family protein